MSYVNCQNCGQANADVARVCRYCGTQLQHRPAGGVSPARPPDSYVPPHMWQSGALPQQLPSSPMAGPQPAPQLSASDFRCPFCGTDAPPVVVRRISTAGWVVFATMIVFCFPLFFIGLLIKEEHHQCSWCRALLS